MEGTWGPGFLGAGVNLEDGFASGFVVSPMVDVEWLLPDKLFGYTTVWVVSDSERGRLVWFSGACGVRLAYDGAVNQHCLPGSRCELKSWCRA